MAPRDSREKRPYGIALEWLLSRRAPPSKETVLKKQKKKKDSRLLTSEEEEPNKIERESAWSRLARTSILCLYHKQSGAKLKPRRHRRKIFGRQSNSFLHFRVIYARSEGERAEGRRYVITFVVSVNNINPKKRMRRNRRRKRKDSLFRLRFP